MIYCVYYRARVEPSRIWYFTAILRSHDHLCFDRTVDVSNSILEFFVPHIGTQEFLAVVERFVQEGVVSDFVQLPNRLELGETL